MTASQTSTAKSISVPVKLSGEYSKRILESPISSLRSMHRRAAVTAMSTMPP